MSQQDLEQSAAQKMFSIVGIKVEPQIQNDDSQLVDNTQQTNTFAYCDRNVKYENLLHDEYMIKDDPDSDSICSELIGDTQQMCTSTLQTTDGVAMHIKEELAGNVGDDEPAPLQITRLMDATCLRLIGPCAGYVRLASIMWPANPDAQRECLHCCIPVPRQSESGFTLLSVPLKHEVEDNVTCLKISSVQSLQKQRIIPNRLRNDDVCVKGKNDCKRKVLKKHAMYTASGNTYQCNICHKSITHKSNLRRHIRLHTGYRLYKCDTCNKGFTRLSSLQIHIRTHTGEKPYKCETCKKCYIDLGSLKRHIICAHTGEKSLKCDFCNKSFFYPSNLKIHVRTHTGERPYKCDICDKGFIDKNGLKLHIRAHTGEKPYKCDACNTTFSKVSSLKRHNKRTHSVEKPYKCDMCNKGYKNIASLKRHHIYLHNEKTTKQM